jgi:hypothetical protein
MDIIKQALEETRKGGARGARGHEEYQNQTSLRPLSLTSWATDYGWFGKADRDRHANRAAQLAMVRQEGRSVVFVATKAAPKPGAALIKVRGPRVAAKGRRHSAHTPSRRTDESVYLLEKNKREFNILVVQWRTVSSQRPSVRRMGVQRDRDPGPGSLMVEGSASRDLKTPGPVLIMPRRGGRRPDCRRARAGRPASRSAAQVLHARRHLRPATERRTQAALPRSAGRALTDAGHVPPTRTFGGVTLDDRAPRSPRALHRRVDAGRGPNGKARGWLKPRRQRWPRAKVVRTPSLRTASHRRTGAWRALLVHTTAIARPGRPHHRGRRLRMAMMESGWSALAISHPRRAALAGAAADLTVRGLGLTKARSGTRWRSCRAGKAKAGELPP